MELKFKDIPLWKIAGASWVIIALLKLGLMIMIFNLIPDFALVVSPLLGITILLSSILAV